MRTDLPRKTAPRDLRRKVERLDGFPLRPFTARFVLGELPDDPDDGRFDLSDSPRWRSVTEFDPGWVLAGTRADGACDPLRVLAESPWWGPATREVSEALVGLWRHAAAVSLAARRLARETNDPDADRLARAGLLHGLGRWAVAAVDPEWLTRWSAVVDPGQRAEMEQRDLGIDLGALGRCLAERWGCDGLIADAAWLVGEHDQGLESAAADPRRLNLLRQAVRLADRTPWSLSREPNSHDPRVKLLTAEVQSRCGLPFVDAEAGPREEALTRSNARLRLRVAELSSGQATRDRFLSALAGSGPTEDPETWAERASLAWCGEAGVSAARVLWQGSGARPVAPTAEDRPPSMEVPLGVNGRTCATVQLWSVADRPPSAAVAESALPAWRAWATLIDERTRSEERLARVARAYRVRAGSDEVRLRAAKLDALAEFAAGAGHELNNPLAVIVGRAQLLLVRETDPKAVRSLRAILTQAQRTHRILRDLMYVARPPEPRPRFCQPDEIVRACLRDARHDADDREVRLAADALDHGARVWADADGLRHLADSLVRNALEATPKGGLVRFSSAGDATHLRWAVHDTGRGITPEESLKLFDPFYCGRQAGRGLGMGLPRAARFVAQVGGQIQWHSTPGQGSTFQVHFPLAEPPRPISVEGAEPRSASA